MYNRYPILLEPLTPLSITQQEIYTKFDYIIEGDKIRIINEDSLYEKLSLEQLYILEKRIIEYPYEKVDFKKILAEDLGLNLNKLSYIYSVKQAGLQGNVDIKRFIRQLEKPNTAYIPGSSIKGAINTSFLAYVLRKNNDKLKEIVDKVIKYGDPRFKRKKKKIKSNIDRIVNEIIKAFSSEIMLRDSEYIDDDKLAVIKAERIFLYKPKKKPVPIFLETVLSTQTNENVIKGITIHIKKNSTWNIEKILLMINENTRKIIDFELETYKNGFNLQQNLKLFYTKLKNIMEKLDKNEAIFPIGFGTHFHTKTIWILIKEFAETHGQEYWRKRNWIIKNVIDMHIPSYVEEEERRKRLFSLLRIVGNNFYRFPTTRLVYKKEKNVYPLGWVKIKVCKENGSNSCTY